MQLRLAECALKSRVSNVLKGKLQRELKLARSAAASRALIDRRCNLPETQGVRQIGKGRSVLRAVEHVVELSSPLQLQSLRDGKRPRERRIHLPQVRGAENVSPGIAPCSVGGNSEGGRVEPLDGRLAAWRCKRNAWDEVRAFRAGTD